jgi:hypothetical protein
MNVLKHSEVASTAFQVLTIGLMAVFSVLSLLRGAGMMF